MPLLFRGPAAEHLTKASGVRFTETTLSGLASKGEGPPYTRLAGRVVYSVEGLDAWLAERLADTRPSSKRTESSRPIAA